MRTVAAFIFYILLGCCQCQSIVSNSNAPAVTDPPTSPIIEVITETSPAYENITASNAAINEALTFGDNVIFVVSERLPSLPEEVRPIGEKILQDTKDGLQICENTLRQNGIIWEYKVCSSSYLRYAMSAFGGLAQESIRSGAGRPNLFFM